MLFDGPSTEKTNRGLPFSENWPDKLQSILQESPKDCCWQAEFRSGKKFRLSPGSCDLPGIPEPTDFPLTISPVPEEDLMREELERLQLQEELLAEQLLLFQLEEQERLAKERMEKRASLLNSSISASSDVAPSACFLVAVMNGWISTSFFSGAFEKVSVAATLPISISEALTCWTLFPTRRPWRWMSWTSMTRTGLWVYLFYHTWGVGDHY